MAESSVPALILEEQSNERMKVVIRKRVPPPSERSKEVSPSKTKKISASIQRNSGKTHKPRLFHQILFQQIGSKCDKIKPYSELAVLTGLDQFV